MAGFAARTAYDRLGALAGALEEQGKIAEGKTFALHGGDPMIARWVRTTLAGFMALVAAASVIGLERTAQPSLDVQLNDARNRLLLSYAAFKGYALTNPQDIYAQKLSPDRQALFDAIVRAAFVQLEDSAGKTTGKRVIDFVEAVHGIWGVRLGEKEGRRMFRVSVRLAPKTRAALGDSSNITQNFSGHVLLPVAVGGDDDPMFTAFDIRTRGEVVTFRQHGPRPNLQISLLEKDERAGEIDLDFDTGCGPWPIKKCHCRPANSDFGSHTGAAGESHAKMFNTRIPFFSNALSSAWSNSAAHCKDNY